MRFLLFDLSYIDAQKLLLHDPKSGREREIVFIPRKNSRCLLDYVVAKDIPSGQWIFPITYAGAWKAVKKVGSRWVLNSDLTTYDDMQQRMPPDPLFLLKL